MWKDDSPYNVKMDDARRNGHQYPSDFKQKKETKNKRNISQHFAQNPSIPRKFQFEFFLFALKL